MRFSGNQTVAMRLGLFLGIVTSVLYAGPKSRVEDVEGKTRETLTRVKEALEAQRAQRGSGPSVEPVLKEVTDHLEKRKALDQQIADLEKSPVGKDSEEAKKLRDKRDELNEELKEIGRRRGYEIT